MDALPHDDGLHALPSAPDVEWAVLGALLADVGAWKAISRLRAEHFYQGSARKIFLASKRILSDGGRPDSITLMDDLGEVGVASLGHDRYSGAQVLASVEGRGPVHPDQLDAYIRILVDRACRRNVIRACHVALADVSAEDLPVQDTLTRLTTQLIEASPHAQPDDDSPLAAGLARDFAELEAQQMTDNHGLVGISTSLDALDDITGGYEPGQLIIIGAYPGGGKTSLALQTALCCAVDGATAVVKSLEMSGRELRLRLLSTASGVPSWRIRKSSRTAPLDEKEWRALDGARHALGNISSALIIDDGADASPGGIIAGVKRRNAEGRPVRLLVVDYLQLLEIPNADSVDGVAWVTRRLKRLAMEESARGNALSVILLTQLTKPQGDSVPKRPTMHSIRGSGLIGADGDKILIVHREEQFLRAGGMPVEPEKLGAAEIIVAKQRNGDVGVVQAKFDGPTCSFSDWLTPAPRATSAARA